MIPVRVASSDWHSLAATRPSAIGASIGQPILSDLHRSVWWQHENNHASKSRIRMLNTARRKPVRQCRELYREGEACSPWCPQLHAMPYCGPKAMMDVMIAMLGEARRWNRKLLQAARAGYNARQQLKDHHREKDAAQVLRELGNGSIQPRCDEAPTVPPIPRKP